MKGKKCFGLLLLLSIMVGLSLSVFSENTNAIQYSVDSFMAHPFLGQDSLSIKLTENIPDLHPRNASHLNSDYSSSNNKCKYRPNYGYSNPGYSYSSTDIVYSGSFLPPWTIPNYSPTDSQRCNSMYPFGYSDDYISVPSYDSDSVPFTMSINVSSMLPYNYMYNIIPFNNVRTVDGVDYYSRFDISELLQNTTHPGDSEFTYYLDKIHSFSLPLNFDASLESFEVGDNITLAGRLDFSEGLTESEASNLFAELRVVDISNDYSGFSPFTIPCTLSYFVNGSNNSVSFYCSGNVPSGRALESGLYNFSFYFGASTSGSPISATPQSLTFSDFMFTFFNDPDTYGGSGSISGNGSFPNVAPGIARVDSENADWFSSLTNLFGFSFINPFAPLFNMFTDQSQCASIPILAGMLHAESSFYCPWFSSETRSILTPVLSIASVMLIFGFAVRWLSSSSGNMFEDQTTHKWGNTQFKGGK